jgi:hypothetical protein
MHLRIDDDNGERSPARQTWRRTIAALFGKS